MQLTRYGWLTGCNRPKCVSVSESELEKLEAEVEWLRTLIDKRIPKLEKRVEFLEDASNQFCEVSVEDLDSGRIGIMPREDIHQPKEDE